MHQKSNYETVSEAITALRDKGFITDFNLEENCLICGGDKFKIDELEIVEVYHYEGNSDPSDEASVYGIESKSGTKGILVVGSGLDLSTRMTETLKRLKIKRS
jgi:hypothetical protein